MKEKTDTERLAEALANLAATMTKIIDSKVRELTQTGSAKGLDEGGINALTPAEGWVTFQQTADHLKISRRTLYDWMKRGYVPYIRIGKGMRFKLSDVDEAMKRRAGFQARC